MKILGISAFDHDAAAALVCDGEIVAAAQEERFTRIKHDASFPEHAIKYCLQAGGVKQDELDVAVFYEKPLVKFGRMLETYASVAPRGLRAFVLAMPEWVGKKLFMRMELEEGLARCGCGPAKELLFTAHHEAHAAAAFFPSPYRRAAIVTVDGVGEWATSTIGIGEGSRVRLVKEQRFPHSLGLLYSAFTYYCGFKVNGGEYKLMGLAPYGEPVYVESIKKELVQVREDGSLQLNMEYFGYVDGQRMTNERFERLFGGPPRTPEGALTAREANLARSIQAVTEEIMLRIVRHAQEVTGAGALCMAGEVALNCVANGRIVREGPFRDVWIQPAPGDAGGAVGAALFAWHQLYEGAREPDGVHDAMKGSLLGPEYSDEEIGAFLLLHGYPARRLRAEEWADDIAELLAQQHVIGLVQGRMEFGPRALGNRSIIADARSPKMQSVLNMKIKYRESFRPFAPSCRVEKAGEYFELDRPSPYMLLVGRVRAERCRPGSGRAGDDIVARVHEVRSDIPAVTHVDYTARIQTVDRQTNARFYELLRAWERKSGCGVLINTSFNVRGEPMVCTLEDAYRCFMRTEMDYLVLGSYVLEKKAQPPWDEGNDWRERLTLD